MWVQELVTVVRGEISTLTYVRSVLVGAVEPDVPCVHRESISWAFQRDVVYDVGASVLRRGAVVEAVLDLIRGGAEEVVGLLVLEATVLVVLGLEVVAFFRTHVGVLVRGHTRCGRGAVAFATDIGGAQRFGAVSNVDWVMVLRSDA